MNGMTNTWIPLFCGYDGRDCDDFNAKYPDCPTQEAFLVGDGSCDDGFDDYINTAACGYNGGDCL